MTASALAVLTLVATSCGGDDDDDTTATTAGEVTTSAAAPETTGAPDTTAAAPDTTAEASPGTTGAPVESQTIKIGFAWPDLSAFEAASPAYGVGDQEQQLLSVLEAWRADGTLPVNGIDIEPVFESFDALDPETKLAACQTFGNAGDVFAVLGARIFTEGAECLGSRFQIPVIDTDQAPAATLESAAPYMFTMKPDTSESVRLLVNWASGSGMLDGKKVGLYWESGHSVAADLFKELLADTGATLASEVESGGQGSVGAEQDGLAAQRFAADGVDLVVFLVGSSSMVNFIQAAEDQGYQPGYIDFEWSSHMSDVASGAFNPAQWGGTKAISATTIGDMPDLSPEADKCISDYESFSGTTIDRNPPEKSGEFSNILVVCDLANILLEGLKGATDGGAELTAESFIAAVEGINGLPGAWVDSISFSADDHTAPATVREVTYDVDCPCWRGAGDWTDINDYLG
ncbi:MAG: ABC transporter substrate-binding protein [Ilumatobacteraceae bacterium]